MIERLVSQGLSTGAADSDVLKTMLEQSTEQTYATTSDDKVRAREGAKASERDLETFKDAQDREREHQKDMTKLSTDMMDASKQTPGSTIIAGTGTPGNAQGPSNVNIVNTPGQTGAAPDTGPKAKCPSCGTAIEQDWNNCPKCGQKLN